MEKLATGVTCAALVLASISCGASPSSSKQPTSSVLPAATWTSPRFGYKWTLSQEWEFYPMNELELPSKKLAIDLAAARPKGSNRPSATLLVWDYTIQEHPRTWGSNAADYDDLEALGTRTLETHGAEPLGTRRITMFGQSGVEVVGMLNSERLSLRMVRRDRRHFEVRCISAFDESDWPCEAAFETFAISEPPARPALEGPRVLHLREPRFGLEFDAPDDSWLATGPHKGGGGAQLVWMWRQADRGIDVQVMDFRNLPAEPTEEQLLQLDRESLEKNAAKVVVGTAFLGGERCHHLRAAGSDGWHRDVFFLHRNSINYTVLIMQRKRDAKLIARVTKALRFTPFEHERERREARLTPRLDSAQMLPGSL